jgi:hypothetical protein
MKSRRRSTQRWKWCWISFLLLIAAGSSFAQGNLQVSAPPIEVLKLKWEKEVRLPRNFDPSVIPTGSTFSDPASRSSGPASTAADTSRGGSAARNTASPSNPTVTFPATPGRLPVFYVYTLKIRNVSDKEIEGIAWDYVFIDPNSGAELGRHRFLSYVKVQPNTGVTLKGQMRSPPLRIVSASFTGKHVKPIERASIQCVLFDGGTNWRNPAGSKGVCEFLKSGDTLMKQKRNSTQH